MESAGILKVQEALDIYSVASGQEVNLDKSTVLFSPNTSSREISEVTNMLKIKETQGHSMYLGLPTFAMKKKKMQFDYIRERACSKLKSWKNRFFSYGGKETLIKAVIQSIPTYTMSCFRIPEGVCADMEKLCADFWWGETDHGKAMHWTRWDKLCQPKSKEGLGFRKFSAFNKAMLAKQVWRILKYPNSLLARTLKGRYFKESSVLEAKVTSNASYTWRSICWGREIINGGLKWKIGNGKTVRAFHVAWLPGFTVGKPIRTPQIIDDRKVADFLTSPASWNSELLEEAFTLYEIEGIKTIIPMGADCEDTCFWHYDEKGRYTVKSGYLQAIEFYEPNESTTSKDMEKWWRCIWSTNVPPKVKHFAWRVLNNMIATEENLKRHHVPVKGLCFWCAKDWGTTSHCLVFCSVVKEVWKVSNYWHRIKKLSRHALDEICRCIFAEWGLQGLEDWFMRLWLLWKHLCEWKHGGDRGDYMDISSKSAYMLENFKTARIQVASTHSLLPKEGDSKWVKPLRDILRLDVDVAVSVDGKTAGVGFLLRDHDGKIVAAVAQRIGAVDTVLMGELHAMMLGVGFCLEHDYGLVYLYTNSLLAVHVVQDSHGGSDSLCDDLFDAFVHARKYVVLDFFHARREANQVAYSLAYFAVISQNVMIWKSDFPSWLLDIAQSDLE